MVWSGQADNNVWSHVAPSAATCVQLFSRPGGREGVERVVTAPISYPSWIGKPEPFVGLTPGLVPEIGAACKGGVDRYVPLAGFRPQPPLHRQGVALQFGDRPVKIRTRMPMHVMLDPYLLRGLRCASRLLEYGVWWAN